MVERTGSRAGAVWSYLGAALVGFTCFGIFVIWLVPLAIRSRTGNPWTRQHATHAANFGLTSFLAILGGALLSALIGLPSSYPQTQPLPMLLVFCYILVGLVGLLVGAVRAGSGQDFRFIKSISLRLLG
ncbi:DUF4870 domain-containing protein [Streptomyces yerevanensis]|uniref:DUF4870 domain-containing protein n=1 Tax=Streptomyces yerevanensis TaxID=66378 RepID=UPI0005278D14|nr:DUF4870 domain-containing protein [Streptomyces yerevanensis]